MCRICLLPEGFVELTSLFKGDAGNAKLFEAFSGVDVDEISFAGGLIFQMLFLDLQRW